MPLQLHPIALGCMLVVAFGTLVYTLISTRQQPSQYGPINEEPERPRPSLISLPKPPEDSAKSNRKRKNIDSCSICLATLRTHLRTLECKHVFHSHCISTWLMSNRSCPICRSEII